MSLIPDSTTDPVRSPFSLEGLDPTPPELLEDGRYDGSWYQWRLGHWGTKWDLADVRLERTEGRVTVEAISAWNPPLAALRSLSRRYPRLRVRVRHEDPGYGVMGETEFRGGVRVHRSRHGMTWWERGDRQP